MGNSLNAEVDQAIKKNDIQLMVELYKKFGHQQTIGNIPTIPIFWRNIDTNTKNKFIRKILSSDLVLSSWFFCFCLDTRDLSEKFLRELYQKQRVTLKTLKLLINQSWLGQRHDLIKCAVGLGLSAYSIDWGWVFIFRGNDIYHFKQEMLSLTDSLKFKTNLALVLKNQEYQPLMQRKDIFYAICQFVNIKN